MLFSGVIGQEEVKRKLKFSAISGRIPHAQLFSGPNGCGSLALAIAYAQFISCRHRTGDDACGTCPSCIKMSKLAHPDLHFAFPVNTNKSIVKDPVSDDFIALWRAFAIENPYFRQDQWYNKIGIENKQGLISKKESEAIIRKLNLKSYEAEYKFMIIWLPEKMNDSAANTLLKLIEEPPKNTLFILISEEPGKLLATIASRTQQIKLGRIDDAPMAQAISEKYNFSPTEVSNIVRLANGNYIQALEIINSSEENEFYLDRFVRIMRLCYSRDFLEINAWVDEMSGIGRERLKNFFVYALRMVRENFILNLKNDKLSYLTDKEALFSKKFHPFINGKNIVQLQAVITTASSDIERNAYAKIVLFDMALQLVKLIPTQKQLSGQ